MTKGRRKKRHVGTSRMPATLSDRERRFVDAYVGEAAGNGREAARIAGYSGTPENHNWNARGSELLDRARVREAIDARRKELAALQREADEIARKEKLDELVKARAEQILGPVPTIAELQRFWAAVAFGEIQGPDWTHRMQASDKLARSLGAFVHENETPPVPQVNDGDQPRVQVVFAYVDNGRGPRAPIDALPVSVEDRKP